MIHCIKDNYIDVGEISIIGEVYSTSACLLTAAPSQLSTEDYRYNTVYFQLLIVAQGHPLYINFNTRAGWTKEKVELERTALLDKWRNLMKSLGY